MITCPLYKSPNKKVFRVFILGTLFSCFSVGMRTVAQAATFNKKAVVVLFTGNEQGGAEDEGTGMFKLNTILKERFGDSYEGAIFQGGDVGKVNASSIITGKTLERLHRDPDGEKQLAIDFLKENKDFDSLGIIGYSLGGDTAIELARELAPFKVDLLVTVDPFGKVVPEIKPSNVTKGINYFQECISGSTFLGVPVPPEFGPICTSMGQRRRGETLGGKMVNNSQPINVEEWLQDRSVTHKSIQRNEDVLNSIADAVEQFLTVKNFTSISGPASQPRFRLSDSQWTYSNILVESEADVITSKGKFLPGPDRISFKSSIEAEADIELKVDTDLTQTSRVQRTVSFSREFTLEGSKNGWQLELDGFLKGVLDADDSAAARVRAGASIFEVISPSGPFPEEVGRNILDLSFSIPELGTISQERSVFANNGTRIDIDASSRVKTREKIPNGTYRIEGLINSRVSIPRSTISSRDSRSLFYGDDRGFGVKLSARPIPEPGTILGLMAVAGLGIGLKQKSKRD